MAKPEKPSDSKWLTDEEQRTWRLWIGTSMALQARLDDQLQDSFGLSLGEYAVLVLLSESEAGAMRMSDLADALHISKSLLTHRIAQMERRSLVERQSCPSDRRGSYAVITNSGMKLLTKAAPIHVQGVRDGFIDPLGRTGVDQLEDILARLNT